MSNTFGSPEFQQKWLVPELVSQIQGQSGENVFVEMADELQAVTAAVLRTGKPGAVALKVRVKAVRFKGTNQWANATVDVAVDVVTSTPKPPRRGELQGRFWITEEGWLSPVPPNQGTLDG